MAGLRRDGTLNVVEFLVLFVLLGFLACIMTYSLAGFSQKGQSSACQADTLSLHNAEEANYAQVGLYDTESMLVLHGLLSHVSSWHGVRLVMPGNPGSPADGYTITDIGNRCGHNGDQVGQTASDR